MRKFTHIPEQRWGGGWVGSLPIIRAFDGNRRFFFFLSTFFFLFFFLSRLQFVLLTSHVVFPLV